MGITVDREMFAVKKFSPLSQVAKIYRAKISRAQTARAIFARLIFATSVVAKIKHAEIYHAKKKERENFPIYGIYISGTILRMRRIIIIIIIITCIYVQWVAMVFLVYFM